MWVLPSGAVAQQLVEPALDLRVLAREPCDREGGLARRAGAGRVARERHEPDARAARIEAREHAPRGGDLGGQDRVAVVGETDAEHRRRIRRAAARRPRRCRSRRCRPRRASSATCRSRGSRRSGAARRASPARAPPRTCRTRVDETSRAVARVLDRELEVRGLSGGRLDQPLRGARRRRTPRPPPRPALRGAACERGEAAALPAVERLAQRVEHAADRRREHARRARRPARPPRRCRPRRRYPRRARAHRPSPRARCAASSSISIRSAVAAAIVPDTSCSSRLPASGPEQAHARARRERAARIGRERAHAARLRSRAGTPTKSLAHRSIGGAERAAGCHREALGHRDRRARARQARARRAARARAPRARTCAPCRPPPCRARAGSRGRTRRRARRGRRLRSARDAAARSRAPGRSRRDGEQPATAVARIVERRTHPPRRSAGAARTARDTIGETTPQLNATRSVPRAYLRRCARRYARSAQRGGRRRGDRGCDRLCAPDGMRRTARRVARGGERRAAGRCSRAACSRSTACPPRRSRGASSRRCSARGPTRCPSSSRRASCGPRRRARWPRRRSSARASRSSTSRPPGSPRASDAIIEIGAVRVEALCATSRFETLVRPPGPGPLSAAIVALTGIDDALLAPAPPAHRALASFARWLGEARGAPWVAHNARFDSTLPAPRVRGSGRARARGGGAVHAAARAAPRCRGSGATTSTTCARSSACATARATARSATPTPPRGSGSSCWRIARGARRRDGRRSARSPGAAGAPAPPAPIAPRRLFARARARKLLLPGLRRRAGTPRPCACDPSSYQPVQVPSNAPRVERALRLLLPVLVVGDRGAVPLAVDVVLLEAELAVRVPLLRGAVLLRRRDTPGCARACRPGTRPPRRPSRRSFA